MKRGDFVVYSLRPKLPRNVLAVVRRVHRDGSFTVEARFLLNAKGKPEGSYLGYKYRMDGSDLHSTTGAHAQ